MGRRLQTLTIVEGKESRLYEYAEISRSAEWKSSNFLGDWPI